ncbi:hypothetical protein [Methyloraptor flagellatus]|jgi:hypothetical protein|uniref:DUF3368 domain-containing protein n=1 Tax=Methyloraptor flagellatus TaxID=3162530 RepID=A0AAU7X5B1_9HYPH
MMTPADRQPIVVADAGPLIRLAAAGLLDTLRGLNRRIVLVDRVVDEVCGDVSKPFASDVADWIVRMGDAIWPARTAIGIGVETLRAKHRTADEDLVLKQALRNAGELAVREFIDGWMPAHPGAAVVVYEDRKVASLFMEADYPVTLMTTRAFARVIAEWGINVDAVEALEAVAARYDLKPAIVAEVDPSIPTDLRQQPQSSQGDTR